MASIYICNGISACIRKRHDVKNVTAYIFSFDHNKLVEINVSYCVKCKKYFISEESFSIYSCVYGNLMVKIQFEDSFNKKIAETYNNFKASSELSLRGYNVRADGPKMQNRQTTLSTLVQFGLMNKQNIIQHIEWCMRIHKHHNNAVVMWQEDLRFLNSINLEKQDKVIGELIRKISRPI